MADYKNLYVATEKTMATTVRRWTAMLCGANELLSDWCIAITIPSYNVYIRGGKNKLTLCTDFEVNAMRLIIQIFPSMFTRYGDTYTIEPNKLEILNVNWFFRDLVKYKDYDTSKLYRGRD